jgi:hypothetical protein
VILRASITNSRSSRASATVTSQVSQSKEREKMFALALLSGLPQGSATQALVSISRAQMEARVYTDSIETFRDARPP